MGIANYIDHVFAALEPRQHESTALAATVCKSLSQDKNEAPTAGIGTADAGTFLAQYRQEVYGYERLIERLYDLARANRYDELHDVVRAKYLSIHGEPR